MARINLLPWRAELRKQRLREFLTAAGGSLVVMLLIIMYGHIHITGLIDHQTGRNRFLEKQIEEVDARINEIKELEKQKQQLIARMKVIERLQRNRPEIVHLFDELVKATPDGLYLANLKQSGSTLIVEGYAQSNARVSAFMRGLDSSPWFKDPVLEVIQISTDKAQSSRQFTLSIKQESGGEA